MADWLLFWVMLILTDGGLMGGLLYWKTGTTNLDFCALKENKSTGFLTRSYFFSLVL